MVSDFDSQIMEALSEAVELGAADGTLDRRQGNMAEITKRKRTEYARRLDHHSLLSSRM